MISEWALFVLTLQQSVEGSIDCEIGTRIWELSTKDPITAYLTEVMDENPLQSHAWYLARTGLALLSERETAVVLRAEAAALLWGVGVALGAEDVA